MITIRGIKIVDPGKGLYRTRGLAENLNGRELLVRTDFAKSEVIANLFGHLIKYIQDEKPHLKDGDQISFGSWIVKCHFVSNTDIQIKELDENGKSFTETLKFALFLWDQQATICKEFGAGFDPPSPANMIVISPGVFEGMPVQGVRYPSPPHMSGWWISTDQYNGDINTMENHHVGHLITERPDLAPYLALPFGYRFNFELGRRDVWFEQEVLK